MPRGHKHKEWRANKKKYHRNSKKSFNAFLILGLFFASALFTLKDNLRLIYNKLHDNDHFISNIVNNNFIRKILEATDDEDNAPIAVGSVKAFRNISFTNIDNYAATIQYKGNSVAELASLLSHSAKTEAEKARIIYSWIAYNITYDLPTYLSDNYGDSSPQKVLITRKGVCSGYANLYKALARAMGLEAIIIDGYAKGYGYVISNNTQINHAWNAVKINNRWYLLDPTWGAGNIKGGEFNRQFNPYYFATPPEQFIFDHFPVENKWQLLAKHHTREQFNTTPEISPEFFKDGLHLVSHLDRTIRAHGRFQVILSAPKDTIAVSRLKVDTNYLNASYTFVQKKGNKIVVTAAPPVGNSKLEIFSKNKHALGAYQQSLTYNVISDSIGDKFPKTYSTFLEKNSYLYAPLAKYLSVGRLIYFKIEVPTALEVQVINSSSNKWIKLTRTGTTFSGYVPVSPDKIQVSAKFPGDRNYWDLVEYN
ncbi:MAG: hypothetical protein JOZ78_09885 [Chroococcidiopsidaceae cyanobacterium CP_BM_ER_R8_30]|nr:hypothetical protein [Chroococcidiopsidaceae cyanobacterium CP_BM_ER_R8_30]